MNKNLPEICNSKCGIFSQNTQLVTRVVQKMLQMLSKVSWNEAFLKDHFISCGKFWLENMTNFKGLKITLSKCNPQPMVIIKFN